MIFCSVVGYIRYLIALFAIFLTLRLNVLPDNVYSSSSQSADKNFVTKTSLSKGIYVSQETLSL